MALNPVVTYVANLGLILAGFFFVYIAAA